MGGEKVLKLSTEENPAHETNQFRIHAHFQMHLYHWFPCDLEWGLSAPSTSTSLLRKRRTEVGEAILKILGWLANVLYDCQLIIIILWQIGERRTADQKICSSQTVAFMKNVTGWKWLSFWQLWSVGSDAKQLEVLMGLPQVLATGIRNAGGSSSPKKPVQEADGGMWKCHMSTIRAVIWQGSSWAFYVLVHLLTCSTCSVQLRSF